MVETWERVQIGDSFEFKNGLNKAKEFFGKGTPIVNYTDVYKKRGLYKADIKGKVTLSPDEIRRFQVEKNDVFFTRTSETPEEVGFASVLLEEISDCVFSGFILRAHPKNEKFFPMYCKYCFMTPDIREAIAKSCTYTTRALTNGRQLSAIEILLPPYAEQKRIAEALSDMDELIASLEKLIAKKKAIKQGAMQELLTGKRRLPGFSGEWDKTTIGKVTTTSSGGTPSREVKGYYEGSIPWITTSELQDCRIYDSKEHITSEAVKSSSAKLFPKGTVLMAMYGATIGKLGVLEIESTTNQACCALICDPSITTSFLYHYLYNMREYILTLGCGAGQPNISQGIVQNLPIVIPTPNEQEEICRILDTMDYEIICLKKRLSKAKEVKLGMTQQLLTGKIRLA